MREQLKQRLGTLRDEFDKGKKKLESLEAEANELRHTLLRISGAIQVLEEELAKADSDASAADVPVNANDGR
jgi:chromosome segregation ATPase